MSCKKLTKNLDIDCAAIKSLSGLDKDVYIGYTKDIDTATFEGNKLTALTLLDDAKLYPFSGRRLKNSAGHDLTVGEKINLRNQKVNLVLLADTAERKERIDELYDSEGMFVIVGTNNDSFEGFGLAKNRHVSGFGLDPSSGTQNSGVAFNDDNSYLVTLAGDLPNIEVTVELGADYDATKTALDAMIYTEPVV